jgi:predicted RNase H-like nuclease (RuvC/YqgF family)
MSNVQHLEQANRSLHRQVEEYKAMNEKLKKQLFVNENNARSNNLLPQSGIF